MTPSPVIGGLRLDGPLVLAPMAGVTDSPFRRICRGMGASLVFSEMVSADGIARDGGRTLEYLSFFPEERPIGVQLFGSKPEILAEAASKAARMCSPDLIDLNCGCPVRKVVGRKAGAALLLDLPLLKDIVRAMTEAVPVPVTVKIRSGWKAGDNLAVEAALAAQEGGASAVTVHARHRSAVFSGPADWDVIRGVKEALDVPVIGNGGVMEPGDASAMLEETGCDAIMIARAAMGNPWIFSRTAALLRSGNAGAPPPLERKLEAFLSHAVEMAELKGERRAVRYMRKQACWYAKGFPGSSAFRRRVNHCTSLAELREAAACMLRGDELKEGELPPPSVARLARATRAARERAEIHRRRARL
jgi:tRNA-dihydrouridine synthase B